MKPRPTLAFPLQIPFVQALGLQLWAFADGHAEVRMDVADDHLNSWQVAHGGVIMTLLDVAMAHAARSVHRHLPECGPGVATVEMKTSFMRPAEGLLSAHGTLLHRSATLAFTEGRVVDDAGHLCAHATATFKYLRALPTRGRQQRTVQPTSEPSPTPSPTPPSTENPT